MEERENTADGDEPPVSEPPSPEADDGFDPDREFDLAEAGWNLRWITLAICAVVLGVDRAVTEIRAYFGEPVDEVFQPPSGEALRFSLPRSDLEWSVPRRCALCRAGLHMSSVNRDRLKEAEARADASDKWLQVVCDECSDDRGDAPRD